MADCENCPSKGKCSGQQKQECSVKNNPFNVIQSVVAVMSGKGGVGKSTVTSLLARSLREMGLVVGVLDADVTGPSIPRLLGAVDVRLGQGAAGIEPAVNAQGIKIMSLNYMLESEDAPVIWRGPMISGVITQFWTDVFWGELDVLLVDLPPGTGDAALTVMQSLPLSGAVMVSTPQDMVAMIVAKAVHMAEKMNIRVLGTVENMSYVECPDCGKKIDLFGGKKQDDSMSRLGLPLLAELPLAPGLDPSGEIPEGIRERMGKAAARILDSVKK